MANSTSGQDESNPHCDWLPKRARWSFIIWLALRWPRGLPVNRDNFDGTELSFESVDHI